MTKETEKAFKILYCEYKRRRKYGLSKRAATRFEVGTIEKLEAFSKWQADDISYAMHELKAGGYIKIYIYGDIELTESGLEFMEDKPKDFFDALSPFFDLVGLFV